ncbi:MAG TPA: DUF3516 domain-containing protein [Acidimicrobiales bacterium]|nr:DUF3516 domain-containing protein [Acidimicrobiales bacterium]
MRPLVDFLPAGPGASPSDVAESMIEWAADRDLDLYPHQEEAILELLAGNHVVLATPTGSGKSLVALAAHAEAVALGGRSWYTAPVKALVSEKFFELCEQLGPANVGMMTGDTTLNADAPVVCCTTEVLAMSALRSGPALVADTVVLDEFHYYGEPDRGWAWQVPLLELPQARFLLMSATLGDVGFFVDDLTARTGRPTVVIDDAARPVPLRFDYRRTVLHHTIEELLKADAAPLYLVNFTQADAVAQANALASVTKLGPDDKALVAAELAEIKMPPGFGRDLARLLRNGIGVHHAGMLPRHRRLVERLTQTGALKVVSGTDTLGVGVNLPIRTVVFSRLYKFDGKESRLLSAREFHQIAGRAGRAGYDTEGLVVAQAPEHEADFENQKAKAAGDAKKLRKVSKPSPPRGFVHYDEDTFTRLQQQAPEKLESSFRVTPAILLHLLDRPADPWVTAKKLFLDNHEPRSRQRRQVRRAIGLFRALRDGGVVEVLDQPLADGRRVVVDRELQEDFALNQPLAPFLLSVLPLLDRDDDRYAMALLAVVESVLDDPRPVLRAQQDKARTRAIDEMKAAGVDYDERIERLNDITWPKPLADELYEVFDRWRVDHAWIDGANISPKGIVREMWDDAMDFHTFVRTYGLKRSEGTLLRYLSDAYKAIVRTVPDEAKSDEVWDIADWLEGVIAQTDSSLIDEWEALRDGDGEALADVAAASAVATEPVRITTREGAFRALVRTRVFRWVQFVDRRAWDEFAIDLDEAGDRSWTAAKLDAVFEPYFAEHDHVGIDADARGPRRFVVTESGRVWQVAQVLADPEGDDEWRLSVEIDLEASDDAGELQARLVGLTRT